MTPLLEIRSVRRSFAQSRGFLRKSAAFRAVDDVTLTLQSGETLGLVGESGCGKSTLARMAVRLLNPEAGDVLLEGQSIFHGSRDFLTTLPHKLQMIFQNPYSSLNPRLRIGTSVGEALACSGIPKKERETRVAALLQQVGLEEEYALRYPHEFSGGQRQRMAIARALAPEPSIIVCDEPVSALDASVQAQVLNVLKDSQDRLGLSYLFISHDLAVISHMSDRIAVMYRGKIVEDGQADDVFNRPAHPYTQLLLETAARRSAAESATTPINAPQLSASIHPWGGCAFYDRCPTRKRSCLDACPQLRPYGLKEAVSQLADLLPEPHRVRCFEV